MPRTIRELRDETGESQAQLARAIGASAAQVAAWEAGSAPLPDHRRRAVAEHFGVEADDIAARVTQRAAAEARIAELEAEIADLRRRLAKLQREHDRNANLGAAKPN